jgi:hypothetical protein
MLLKVMETIHRNIDGISFVYVYFGMKNIIIIMTVEPDNSIHVEKLLVNPSKNCILFILFEPTYNANQKSSQ